MNVTSVANVDQTVPTEWSKMALHLYLELSFVSSEPQMSVDGE